MGVVGPDPFLLAPEFCELATEAPTSHRPFALAGLLSLLAYDLGVQARWICEGTIHRALVVCKLPRIAVKTQQFLGRPLRHRGDRHLIRNVGIPLGTVL